MKLHVLADLHLEFGIVEIPPTDADVVICAGDVHTGAKGLEWIKTQFEGRPVIYVLGNHEFYHESIPSLTQQLTTAAATTNVHLLENRAVELDGWTFLGCTLWTDFELKGNAKISMLIARDMMNDYRIIRSSAANRTLRPTDTQEIHWKSVAWLKQELLLHDPARAIVVTHHAPSSRSEAPFHSKSSLTPAFASNLDALVAESRVPLWLHGHTHYNADYRLGSTRVLTNQRGYPSEGCRGFKPGMVVKL